MKPVAVSVVDHERARHLWRSWTLATAVGELAGFAVPTVVGLTAFRLLDKPEGGAAGMVMYALLVAAGMGEGAVLGMAQWLVLRRWVTRVGRRAWVLATSLAAGVAWALGLLPSTVGGLGDLHPIVLVAGAIVLAVTLLGSIGVAQWLVLRRHLPRAGWWAPANALAWLLGLPVTFIGPALVPDGSPPAVWATVFIVSGVLMGTIVGAVTGIALVRLVLRDDRSPEPGEQSVRTVAARGRGMVR